MTLAPFITQFPVSHPLPPAQRRQCLLAREGAGTRGRSLVHAPLFLARSATETIPGAFCNALIRVSQREASAPASPPLFARAPSCTASPPVNICPGEEKLCSRKGPGAGGCCAPSSSLIYFVLNKLRGTERDGAAPWEPLQPRTRAVGTGTAGLEGPPWDCHHPSASLRGWEGKSRGKRK